MQRIFVPMNRILPIFLPIVAVLCAFFCSCTTEGERQRMAQIIAEADSLNRNYIPLTSDSLLLEACQYYDRFGSPNERMKAHYLLGCVYRDLGEAPRAIECYQDAIACADTTDNDCNFKQLSRIYGQKAELLYDQLLPNEMLEQLEAEAFYAKKSNDTITYLVARERRSFAYDLIGQRDSAILIATEAYQEYKKYGILNMAANVAGTLFGYLTLDANVEKAKEYMDFYENHSNFFQNGEITPGREIFYYHKGLYYIGMGMEDSAKYCFLKELRLACDINNREAAYKGLYHLYKSIGLTDSVAKYADLCYAASDEQYRQSTSEELQHMHALYNYNRSRAQAQQKSREASEANFRLTLFMSISFIGIIIASFIVYTLYQRKEAQIAMMALRKEKEIEAILQKEEERRKSLLAYKDHQLQMVNQAKEELVKMQKMAYSDLQQKKEQEIVTRQKEIDRLQEQLTQIADGKSLLLNSSSYERIRYYAMHPNEHIKASIVKLFLREADQLYPSFYYCLRNGSFVNDEDYYLCLLIHLGFSISEIGNLAGIKSADLSKKRRRLLKKWYNIDGKPEEFDKRIRELFY